MKHRKTPMICGTNQARSPRDSLYSFPSLVIKFVSQVPTNPTADICYILFAAF